MCVRCCGGPQGRWMGWNPPPSHGDRSRDNSHWGGPGGENGRAVGKRPRSEELPFRETWKGWQRASGGSSTSGFSSNPETHPSTLRLPSLYRTTLCPRLPVPGPFRWHWIMIPLTVNIMNWVKWRLKWTASQTHFPSSLHRTISHDSVGKKSPVSVRSTALVNYMCDLAVSTQAWQGMSPIVQMKEVSSDLLSSILETST